MTAGFADEHQISDMCFDIRTWRCGIMWTCILPSDMHDQLTNMQFESVFFFFLLASLWYFFSKTCPIMIDCFIPIWTNSVKKFTHMCGNRSRDFQLTIQRTEPLHYWCWRLSQFTKISSLKTQRFSMQTCTEPTNLPHGHAICHNSVLNRHAIMKAVTHVGHENRGLIHSIVFKLHPPPRFSMKNQRVEWSWIRDCSRFFF